MARRSRVRRSAVQSSSGGALRVMPLRSGCRALQNGGSIAHAATRPPRPQPAGAGGGSHGEPGRLIRGSTPLCQRQYDGEQGDDPEGDQQASPRMAEPTPVGRSPAGRLSSPARRPTPRPRRRRASRSRPNSRRRPESSVGPTAQRVRTLTISSSDVCGLHRPGIWDAPSVTGRFVAIPVHMGESGWRRWDRRHFR
jgi:hypothetical protein